MNSTNEQFAGSLRVYSWGCELNPDSPFPLTVEGDQHGASALKDLLDSEEGHDKTRERAVYLLLTYGLRIREIDEYAEKLRPEFARLVTEQQQASKSWKAAKATERKELLERFGERAVKRLPEHGWELKADTELLSHEPTSLETARSMLSRLGDDSDLWWAYFYGLGRSTPRVLRVDPDARYRARFEKLVALGIAKRGLSIGAARIVASLSLKELNALVADLIDKRARKQVRAASIAIMALDLADRFRRHLNVDDLFWTEPPPGMPLEAFFNTMGYLRATAQLLCNTYYAGLNTRRTVVTYEEGSPARWRIRTSECCVDCKENATGWQSELPDKLPPFHVGCGCELEAQ